MGILFSLRALATRQVDRRGGDASFLSPSTSILSTTSSVTAINQKDPLANVNLYAGCDLLEYFHHQWRKLHQSSLDNQKLAEQVAGELRQVEQSIKDMCGTMQKLNDELLNLDSMQQQLSNIEIELGKTFHYLDKLSEAIGELQCEQAHIEAKQQKQEAKARLDKTINEKTQQIEDHRRQLLQKQEENERKILKEREKVFQQVFEEELQLYKEKGQLPVLNKTTDGKACDNNIKDKRDLGNVTIEFDEKEQQEFEKFLAE